MVKLYDEFKDNDLAILAIDLGEKKEIVKKYAAKVKMSFPVLLDIDGKVARDYGVRGVPTHFLINRQGEIIGSAVGARAWASVESRNLIRFLIAQKSK